MAPVDADNSHNRRRHRCDNEGAGFEDDGAPRRWRRLPVPGRVETIGAERSEILAHKCHEALKTLGPGGVAVAVVGSEHVSAIGRQFGKRTLKSEPRGRSCQIR